MHWSKWSLGIVATAISLTGCGRPGVAPTAPVSGVVTLNGAPATDARVSFIPSKGRPAFGDTDDQGRFILTTFTPEDGAVPGQHTVTVSDQRRSWLPDSKTNKVAAGRFPDKYESAVSSPWKVEVKDGEDNDFEFKMTD